MAWLWTDTLAALLVEHDGVAPEGLSEWVRRPVGYRVEEGVDPLVLARRVLLGIEDRPAPNLADAG
jgi:hypothetical protein